MKSPSRRLRQLATPRRIGARASEVAALFDYVEDVLLWIKDVKGHYRWMNLAFLLNFGAQRREEVSERTDFDLCSPALANQYRLDDERVLQGECILWRVELVGRFDHTARWCVTSKVPLHDAKGNIVGTAGVTHPLQALHPEKTRLLDLRRPVRSRGEGRSPTSFDFLGFCWHWRRTRQGSWAVTCKTRRARLVRAVQRVHAWCRENRHLPVRQQHETLRRKVQGHINYYGINVNIHSLKRFVHQAKRSWFKWLNRRSQRARLNWERYQDLLRYSPLPNARIVVSIWR